jgi:thiamine-monophosphate kinase
MKEFQLIRQIQQQTSVSSSDKPAVGVVLGIGDDAAVLEIPEGRLLVAATDTLNAGTHFPEETSPYDIGYKCLAVNLSDLAAMGAVPHWALLSLSLPKAETEWVRSFTDGLMALAQLYGVSRVGGDTTSGPMSISLTAMGSVTPGLQMLRSAAKPGDLLVVSGTIGGAAYALALLQQGSVVAERDLLDRPKPRVELGQLLAGDANACIDVSDGLLADLGHILKASGCGARIEVDKLPCSNALSSLESVQRWSYQLSGGDDYELLFTLPRSCIDKLPVWSQQLNLGLSIIGEIVEAPGIQCIGPDGVGYQPESIGFEHFGSRV